MKKIVIYFLLQAFAFAGVYELATKAFSEIVSVIIAIVAFAMFNWLLWKWFAPNGALGYTE